MAEALDLEVTDPREVWETGHDGVFTVEALAKLRNCSAITGGGVLV